MATVTESTTVEETVLSSTSRSTFSRKSATYTASTFTAFEYGSSYEYHGMYNNIEGDKTDSNAKSDLEMEQNSSLQVNLFHKHLFLPQLTYNCSLNYKCNTWKFQAQNMSRKCCVHKLFWM